MRYKKGDKVRATKEFMRAFSPRGSLTVRSWDDGVAMCYDSDGIIWHLTKRDIVNTRSRRHKRVELWYRMAKR